ncbi:uncharacterized protein THITE_2090293 [Thermothielavioides terrestris NRRL 8126]|uniref:Uncharacterized protein n=1 Tax=Thermothielavioides terrestris (strain ATCC 38088 / NRRL 8126) TaxID=578455 RepID=G2R9Z6_THETT|nr:uncharacterized protein THITE_2090293 [Thermothielavioides terrestris NRRL 8126]AEO68781.1 hypothetical protein THITE_2090293 [Thermothielavioides terrestris NRRL 8126]
MSGLAGRQMRRRRPPDAYMAAWVTRQRAASGFLHGQVWILANKTHGDTPEWVGNLEVYSPFYKLLPTLPSAGSVKKEHRISSANA